MNEVSLSKVLTNEDLHALEMIRKELDDAWNKQQIFRTDTEARYAVLNDLKFPTKASKYWQAIREQMAHFEGLTILSFEVRKKEIDLEEVEDKLNHDDTTYFDQKRLKVQRDELLYQIANAKLVAKDRVREIMQWSQIKKEVNDGSFDDKNVNTHQRETLFKTVLNRANSANPETMPSEEKLSIQGILHMLKEFPENKKLLEKILEKSSS